jgi:hypothetical protein
MEIVVTSAAASAVPGIPRERAVQRSIGKGRKARGKLISVA